MKTSRWKLSGWVNAPGPKRGWVVVFLSLLGSSGCAMYERALRPTVPQSIQVPAGHKLLLPTSAKGVQIYRCESNPTNLAQLIWVLRGPEAMLFDHTGAVIGSHYAGPTWEFDDDRSRVVGTVIEQVASPKNDAIPWLLLTAATNQGPGLFQRVTFVQRVNTRGGQAPAAAGTQVGQEVRVPYTADYFFYRRRD